MWIDIMFARDMYQVYEINYYYFMNFIFNCIQYSNSRKDGEPCDLYWHSVSFSETADLQSGKINKFPGWIDFIIFE